MNGIFLTNQIVNLPQAITTEGQLIGHGAHSIFTPKNKIRSLSDSRNLTYESKANFLGCGDSGAPYGTTISAKDKRYRIGLTSPWSLYVIVDKAIPSRWVNAIRTRIQHWSWFSQGGERLTDVHLPVLPLQNVAIHLEAHTFRLYYMEGLYIFSRVVASFFGLCH